MALRAPIDRPNLLWRAGVIGGIGTLKLLSFSDDSTWKGRSQRRRGVDRRRSALMPEQLFAEAAVHGLEPLGRPLRLNGFHSLVAVAVFTCPGARS